MCSSHSPSLLFSYVILHNKVFQKLTAVRHSRNFQCLLKHVGLLLWLANVYRGLTLLFHNCHLNIILLSMCWSSMWSLYIRFFYQIPNGVSSLPWYPHVPPALSYCFLHYIIFRAVHVMKLLKQGSHMSRMRVVVVPTNELKYNKIISCTL
jgi:hypothetical protein